VDANITRGKDESTVVATQLAPPPPDRKAHKFEALICVHLPIHKPDRAIYDDVCMWSEDGAKPLTS